MAQNIMGRKKNSPHAGSGRRPRREAAEVTFPFSDANAGHQHSGEDPQSSKVQLKNKPSATSDSTESAEGETSFANGAPTAEGLPSWSSNAKTILCLNAYPNGITFSVHSNDAVAIDTAETSVDEGPVKLVQRYEATQFHLRLKETRDYHLVSGKYYLMKEGYARELEGHLSGLARQGLLSTAVLYFGVIVDPFMHFAKKFAVTMACLELLERYPPGFVVVQTRSPMIVAGLPALKALGQNVVVGIPVESRLESSITRYTPEQPRIAERLVAADGLRQQGVRVNLIASPILPYGELFRHAVEFAELLAEHGDFISVGGLATGHQTEESKLKNFALSQRLVADGHFRFLRPQSYRQLWAAAQQVCPEKLRLPVPIFHQPSQLNLFAA